MINFAVDVADSDPRSILRNTLITSCLTVCTFVINAFTIPGGYSNPFFVNRDIQ